MRHLTSCLLGASLFAASAAWAEGAKGSDWDDSHMQSRHQEFRSEQRPRITGESGYGALQSGSATTSLAVSPELEYTTQRQWIQGALSSSSSSSKAPATLKASGDKTSGISRGSSSRGSSRRSSRR